MSKKSKSKTPSVGKAGEKTTPEVIKMIKKAMPKKNAFKKVAEPVAEPVKPVVKVPLKKPQEESSKVIKTKLKNKVVDLPPEHEKYFVYLKNPLEYRRHLLEGSKHILYCLKHYQKLVLIRQKKLDEMQRLKASLKELTYLNKKFNEMLPKYNVTFLEDMPNMSKAPIEQVKEFKEPKLKPIVEKPKERTEVDRLEESLARIEAKLRDLK